MKKFYLLGWLVLILLLLSGCGSPMPFPEPADTKPVAYLPVVTQVPGVPVPAAGAPLYRVVDCRARVVCYYTANWGSCQPFDAGTAYYLNCSGAR